MGSVKNFLEDIDAKTNWIYKATDKETYGDDYAVSGTHKELEGFFKNTLRLEPGEVVTVTEGDLTIEYQYAGFEPRRAVSVGKFLNERSDATIAARKESFNQRFLKHEVDDVRHKHGKLFDDSLRSAEAQRIKQRIQKIKG